MTLDTSPRAFGVRWVSLSRSSYKAGRPETISSVQQFFLFCHHSAIFPCQCLWVCPIQNWSMVSFIQHLFLTLSQQELILCRHFIFAASESPLELIQMITRYQILQPAAWRLNLHTLSWKIRCTEKCSKQLRWHGISYSLPWLLLLRGPAHLTAFSGEKIDLTLAREF